MIRKKVDNKFSGHDAFLEKPSSGILKLKYWKLNNLKVFGSQEELMSEGRQPKIVFSSSCLQG